MWKLPNGSSGYESKHFNMTVWETNMLPKIMGEWFTLLGGQSFKSRPWNWLFGVILPELSSVLVVGFWGGTLKQVTPASFHIFQFIITFSSCFSFSLSTCSIFISVLVYLDLFFLYGGNSGWLLGTCSWVCTLTVVHHAAALLKCDCFC